MSYRGLPGFVFALEVGVVILNPGVDFLQGPSTTGVREQGLGYECCVGNIGFFDGCSGGGGGTGGGIMGCGGGC
jgi:hypothetical protein